MNYMFLKKIKTIKETQGMSMVPTIVPKDTLLTSPVKFASLTTNNIIVFLKKKSLITHRIIYKARNYIITKGDNNYRSDGKIYPRQIVGRVNEFKRNGQSFNLVNLYLLQSTLYFQEIVKIKNAFVKNQIDYVFLKGLPIHLYFERSHPKRLYQDADVLITRNDYQKAKKVLLKFGYQKIDSSLLKNVLKEKENKPEISFYKLVNDWPVVFDIHFEPVFLMVQTGFLEAFYSQKLIDQLNKELLITKRKIKINDETFLMLNTNYLILYLALHFFHHNFRGAFRLELIDKIIRRSNLKKQDWINIKAKVNDFDLKNFVDPVFTLLRKYYQTPIPNFINLSVNRWPLKNVDIFSDESRFEAGVNRFKYIFFLSPRPLIVRLSVFFDPKVIRLVFWSLKQRLFSFLSIRR